MCGGGGGGEVCDGENYVTGDHPVTGGIMHTQDTIFSSSPSSMALAHQS